MSFISKIADVFRAPSTEVATVDKASPTPITKAVDFSNASSLFGFFGNRSHTGTVVTNHTALQITAAYACIRALSEDVACLPIKIRKILPNNGAIAQPRHPIAKLLAHPNAYQTPFEMISHIITSLTLRGNAFVYIIRAGDGTPIELIPLIPDRVQTLINQNDGMIYYHISHPRLSAATMSVPQEDMIHVKNISLDGGVLGVSPIQASQETLGLAQAAQNHAAIMFRQGTMLRGVFTTDGKLSPETIVNLRSQFEKTYAGVDNAHKTAVLEEGMKFEPLSMTAEDSQLLESRKFSVEEIARLFRVPLSKIGVQAGSVANNETQEQSYISNSLMPLCRRIEEAFEQRLLFEAERAYINIRFDFDHMLRANTKERFDSHAVALGWGFLSINEVRAKEGLTPIEGGDDYRIPLNTAALNSDSLLGQVMGTPKKPDTGNAVLDPAKPDGQDTGDGISDE